MRGNTKDRILVVVMAICLVLTACNADQPVNSEDNITQGIDNIKSDDELISDSNDQPHNTVSLKTGTEDENLTPWDDIDIPEDTWNVDKNTIIWAFMDDIIGAEYVEENVNRKLEEDGYDFRLKCVALGYKDYSKKVRECKADIVFSGIKSDEDSDIKVNPAFDSICAGSFLKLDDYLRGSKLYDFFPEVLWDSVKYEGSIYCVPNMNFNDSHLAIIIKKSAYTKEQIEQFDGSLEGLLSLISSENKLYYNSGMTSYLDMYGIANEDSSGIYYEDDKIKNIMDLEISQTWIKTMHQLAMQGMIVDGSVNYLDCKDEWSVAVCNVGADSGLKEEDYVIINYPGDVYAHYNAAIAIKENSHNPDAAFKLLELFLTDSDYGNLIIYGGNVTNDNGYAVDPSGKKIYSWGRRMQWGINDGILKGSGDYKFIFDTPEDRKKYYENMRFVPKMAEVWTRAEYKEFLTGLKGLVLKHDDIIFNEKNFDEELESWIKDSDELFEKYYK